MNYENMIGKIIKEKRKKEDLSIRDLSQLTGLSTKTICEVEKENNIKHTFLTIAKIAKVLNIDLNYLANNLGIFNEINSSENEIIITRKAENIIELRAEKFEDLLDFIENVGCDFGKFVPNVGYKMHIGFYDFVSDGGDYDDLL